VTQSETDLQPVQATALSSDLAPLLEQAGEYLRASSASSTQRAYRSDWRHFEAWCAEHGRSSLPAASTTVALYITHVAHVEKRKCSTIQRKLAAISQAHQVAKYLSPTHDAEVRKVFAGIRRTLGTAQHGKAPVDVEDLRAMVSVREPGLLEQRDRALLLVGFAGAFRRSELVSLDVPDLSFQREGLVITLRRSKTDQEGQGRRIGIPYGRGETCPVHALQAWLRSASITEGPAFRAVNRHGQVAATRLTDQTVARVVKRCAKAIGLDAQAYAGHSLRAGLATAASQAGASERKIMQQTGHRSVIVARRYIREGDLWRENAAAAVGL
jgi:site-specific recombinase XerD